LENKLKWRRGLGLNLRLNFTREPVSTEAVTPRDSWVQIPPATPETTPFSELFLQMKLDLSDRRWGLKFELNQPKSMRAGLSGAVVFVYGEVIYCADVLRCLCGD